MGLKQIIKGLVNGRPLGVVSVTEAGAKGDWNSTSQTGTDNTSVFNSLVQSGRVIYIPPGFYLLDCLDMQGSHSYVLQGSSPTFGSVLVKANTNTNSLLRIGRFPSDVFDANIRDLTLQGNGQDMFAVLEFKDSVNLVNVYNVQINNFGANGTGVKSNTSKYFQEMYFDRLAVYGTNRNGSYNGVGVDIFATGNVNFHHCNIENVATGYRLRGYGMVTIMGGHIERCDKWGIDANDVQLVVQGLEVMSAGIYLREGIVGSRIEVSATSNRENYPFIDLGFGNEIRRRSQVGRKLNNNHDAPSSTTTIYQDGLEWLRVPNANDDPLFLGGTSGWSGTNATLSTSSHTIPGAKRGGTLVVYNNTTTQSPAPGYAQKSFTIKPNVDYLVQVAMAVDVGNQSAYRVAILDGSNNVLYDTGNLDYTSVGIHNNQTIYRWVRKKIKASSNTTLQIRLYSTQADTFTYYPLLLISESLSHTVTIGTANGGLVDNGDGTYTSDNSLNSYNYINFTNNTNTGTMVRFQVRSYTGIPPANIGINNDYNSSNSISGSVYGWKPDTGGQWMDYIMYIPQPVTRIALYDYARQGKLDIGEITIHPVYQQSDYMIKPVGNPQHYKLSVNSSGQLSTVAIP